MIMTKAIEHGDTPSSLITDHPYEPIDQWWSLCKHCRLAQAAHSSSVPEVIAEKKARFERQMRAGIVRRYPTYETSEVEHHSQPQIGYIGDDEDD